MQCVYMYTEQDISPKLSTLAMKRTKRKSMYSQTHDCKDRLTNDIMQTQKVSLRGQLYEKCHI